MVLLSALSESVGFKMCGYKGTWVMDITVQCEHLKRPVFALQ